MTTQQTGTSMELVKTLRVHLVRIAGAMRNKQGARAG